MGNFLSDVGKSITGSIGGIAGDIVGGYLDSKAQQKAAKKAYEQSKEFAQKGIQWKVADAKAAGIHPLYALGAATQSGPGHFIPGQSTYGSAARTAGAAISRAMDPAAKAAVENTQASTDLLKAQSRVADAQAAQIAQSTNPVPPAPGFRGRAIHSTEIPSLYVYARDKDGTLVQLPNTDLLEMPEAVGAYYYGRDKVGSVFHSGRVSHGGTRKKPPPVRGGRKPRGRGYQKYRR